MCVHIGLIGPWTILCYAYGETDVDIDGWINICPESEPKARLSLVSKVLLGCVGGVVAKRMFLRRPMQSSVEIW